MATKKKTDGQEQATAPKGGDFHKAPAKGRKHVATYARDKRKGGYLIRVAGPNAADFAGREVPVLRMDRTESAEKLKALIWSGPDKETGELVALYSFEARPREEAEEDDIAF